MRNRRKRKGSDDDGDSPVQDIDTPEVAKQLIFFFRVVVLSFLMIPSLHQHHSHFYSLPYMWVGEDS